jgi:hypothetical protein
MRKLSMRIAKGILLYILLMCLLSACNSEQPGKHLFILSGQSNMVGMHPEESFNPAVEQKFGEENVIVVKSAYGAQPIRRWYIDWSPPAGVELKAKPNLYDSLMNKVYKSIEDNKIETATFIWMQGERDAREELGEVYEKSLTGLYNQISTDLGRNDVNFIMGRLSDFDLSNEKYPHWTKIREVQVALGESNSRFGWVNTDDLNDGLNRKGEEIKDDLHMSVEGYKIMGGRFAEKAISLIQHNK